MRKFTFTERVFIIAEMSGNHLQSYANAIGIIDAAAAAGCDAIKLQTYTADTITIDSDREYFQVKVNDAWKGRTLYSLYQEAYTPWEWQPKLKEYAESKGLMFFSTPFDHTAVDFLETMGVEIYKVASFEVVDIPLLKRIGATEKPVIMSRGMSSIKETELAVQTLRAAGSSEIALLHCVSAYPANAKDMNLATISDMAKRFGVIVGLSDHTLGVNVAISAVSLGARIIEKHITLARADGGPDAAFSLEPNEFKTLVSAIREVEAARGVPSYGAGAHESENVIFRKSLFVVERVRQGERFTAQNIRSIRPGHGLPPKYYYAVIGKTARYDIERGTPLTFELVS